VRGFDGMAFVTGVVQVDLAGRRVTKRACHRIKGNGEVFTSRKVW
jgi:hypothetical protein